MTRDANGDVTIDDVNSVADYLFILKSTGNRTVVEGTTYFQYQVVIDGEETTRYIAQTTSLRPVICGTTSR